MRNQCGNKCYTNSSSYIYDGGDLECSEAMKGDMLNLVLAKLDAAICEGITNPINLTGDVTGTGTYTIPTTLATVNPNVGTFGDSTHVPQFTVNGKGLITSVSNIAISGGGGTPTLTATEIAYGDGSNLMTSSANFTWNSNALNISSTPGLSSGWGNIQEIISSAGSEAGIALNNTSTGGKQWNIISTSNSSGIGGSTFSIGDASSSINYLMLNSGNIIFPTLAGNGVGIVGVDNTGTLSFTTAGGAGTVTSIATGTGLTGGTITSSGTISLDSKLSPLDSLTGNSLKLVRVNAGETAVEYFTPTYGSGTVTSIATTGPITGGTITSTGTIAITQATTSTDGYLSSTDWNIFNNKGNGTVTSVSGTTNRISVASGTTTPVIDISASYIGQSSLTTLGTITTATWNATIISEIYGGTNQSTYTTGDILYSSASNTLSKLPIGSTNQILTVVGGIPSWQTASSSGITTLNTLTASTQTFAVGTTGTDFNISSVTSTHTFNIPDASATNRGLVTTAAQTFAGAKTFTQAINNALTINGTWTATANTQQHLLFNPTITGRATASDTIIGHRMSPTFISGAATQSAYALYIDPTFTTTGGVFSTSVAIGHAGLILPLTTNTYTLGNASLYYSIIWTSALRADSIRFNTGATFTYTDGSAGTVSRMYVTGDQMWASNGNIDASSNGYKIQAKGEGSIRGGLVIPSLSTPVISTVTNSGSAGATTYTYKVVATLTNGGTTDASAAVSTTTGNATLSGSNFNVISYSEVVGATGYSIYRTVGGATQGKIGTRSATQFSYNDQTGAGGDSTTAPSTNTTGNLGVGTITPTASIHVKAGVAGLNGAPIKLTSGTNLTTAEAGAIEYDGTNLFFSPSTTRHTIFAGLAGSGTLDFGSIASLGNASLTITVTGAADGDPVSLGVPNGSMTAGLVFTAWVSAANTVSVQCYNSTLGAIDPASGTFKVFVKKN